MLPRFILRVKVFAYRFLYLLQMGLVRFARIVPGAPGALRIPNRDIPNLEVWVNSNHRGQNPDGGTPDFVSYPTTRAVARRNVFPAGLLDERPELQNPTLTFDDPFLARLPMACMLGPEGSVICADGGIIEQSTWTYALFQRDRIYRSVRLPEPRLHAGSFYTLTNNFWNNYYHWVVETLTRLFAYPENERPRLIVNSPLAPWQLESLHLMGFRDDELLFLDDGYHRFETLYFPSHIGINPLTLNWLRDQLLPKTRPQPSKRLYVSRRLATRRRVLNENELEPVLLEHGFTFVDLEKFSFAEQVSTFAEAEIVVAIHGAGLTNMVWAPPNCKIMEIMDPNHVSLMYYVLSEVLGQRYWYCGGEATGTTEAWRHGGAVNHGDITVPVELFRGILSDMVAGNSSIGE